MDSASVLQHNGRFWQGKVYPPSANFQSTSYGVTAIAHKKLQSHCRAPISESIDTRQLLFLASKNISFRAGSSPDGKGKKKHKLTFCLSLSSAEKSFYSYFICHLGKMSTENKAPVCFGWATPDVLSARLGYNLQLSSWKQRQRGNSFQHFFFSLSL